MEKSEYRKWPTMQSNSSLIMQHSSHTHTHAYTCMSVQQCTALEYIAHLQHQRKCFINSYLALLLLKQFSFLPSVTGDHCNSNSLSNSTEPCWFIKRNSQYKIKWQLSLKGEILLHCNCCRFCCNEYTLSVVKKQFDSDS